MAKYLIRTPKFDGVLYSSPVERIICPVFSTFAEKLKKLSLIVIDADTSS